MTLVDKANVLKSYAFFRALFDEVAADYPDIQAEHAYVDAMTMYLVQRPGHYDVVVPRTCSATSSLTWPRPPWAGSAWRRRETSGTTTASSSLPTARRRTSPARASPIPWRPSSRPGSCWSGSAERDGNDDAAAAAARIEAAVSAVTLAGDVLTPDLGGARRRGASGTPSSPRSPPCPVRPEGFRCARWSSTGMAVPRSSPRDELARSLAGPGEMVVRVHACALNPLDIFTREGMPGEPTPLPHITGGDIAGTVASVGPGVTSPRVGDRVVLNPSWGCGVVRVLP